MYSACVYFLLQPKARGNMTWFNLAFVTIMFLMSFLLAASTGATCVSAFVDNRNYPGGPDFWINVSGELDRANTVQAVSLIIPTTLADGLLVNLFSPRFGACTHTQI